MKIVLYRVIYYGDNPYGYTVDLVTHDKGEADRRAAEDNKNLSRPSTFVEAFEVELPTRIIGFDGGWTETVIDHEKLQGDEGD